MRNISQETLIVKNNTNKYQRNSSGGTQNLTANHDTEQAGAV
ncbi:TPA: hypothetical protein ACWOWD_003976 [Salmonella enterica subsp. enterica]